MANIDKHSSLLYAGTIYESKKFYTTCFNVIKHFTINNYECTSQARVFVAGRSFQPSLIFVGKTRAYLTKPPFSCSTFG